MLTVAMETQGGNAAFVCRLGKTKRNAGGFLGNARTKKVVVSIVLDRAGLSAVGTLLLLSQQKMDWDAARRSCQREKGDLAFISDQLENGIIRDATKDLNGSVWIGLHENASSWTWSLDASGSPFQQPEEKSLQGGAGPMKQCASVTSNGVWQVRDCASVMPFFCDHGKKSGAVGLPVDRRVPAAAWSGPVSRNGVSTLGKEPYALVDLGRSWTEALDYCRDLYVDLARVSSPDQNQALVGELREQRLEEAWIGLYREPWRSADGTAASFSSWAPNEPKSADADGCAAMFGDQWYELSCRLELDFVCQRRFHVASSCSRTSGKSHLGAFRC